MKLKREKRDREGEREREKVHRSNPTNRIPRKRKERSCKDGDNHGITRRQFPKAEEGYKHLHRKVSFNAQNRPFFKVLCSITLL